MLFSCVSNEASHHERHSSIARLVSEWQSSKDAGQNAPIRKREKSHKQRSGEDWSLQDESATNDGDFSDLITMSEDKAANSDPKETSQSSSKRRALKKTMKDKRNQEKALRNQQRFDPSITQAQIDRVARVIHGADHNVDGIGGRPTAAADDDSGTNNKDEVFNPAIKDHVVWLKKQVKVSRTRNGKKGVQAQKNQEDEDAQNGLPMPKENTDEMVSKILTELGISDHHPDGAQSQRACSDPTANRNRKHNASTIQRLRKEIAADIEKSNNDNRARQQRMDGYWRYVNGTVTDRLAQNAQVVDRATGMRLKEEDNRHRPGQGGETGQEGAGVVSDVEDEDQDQEVEEGSLAC
jgi:hypothetical protein